MADLCLLDENGAIAQQWKLGDRPVAVGRDENADIAVPDKTLSRRHFLIWREGENFLLQDLGSQNGTWVDGERVQETKLSHNLCIVAGCTVFMFSEHRLPAGTALKPSAAVVDRATVLAVALTGQSAGLPNSHASQAETSKSH